MSGRHRKPRSRTPGRHRRPPGPAHWLAPGLVAVALLGAGGVGAHAALSDSGSNSSVTTPITVPDVVTPSPTVSPTVAPSPTPSAVPTAPARQRPSYALRLTVTGSVSWLEVRRPSGHVLVSGLVRHGKHLTYRHGPLSVTIGNAGAVRVSRGGSTHRAGKPGEVVKLSVE